MTKRIPRWGRKTIARKPRREPTLATDALVEREISVLEKIELTGKFAALSLPLTYVSGYLISTSYLGTYGIHLSAGDLLRTKYIYIGFLYLMFLALMIVI